MVNCPYCKGKFNGKEIGVEEIQGSDLILRKVIYYCPHYKTLLNIAGK